MRIVAAGRYATSTFTAWVAARNRVGGSTSLWWRRRRGRRRNDDIFVGEGGVDIALVDDTRDLEIFFNLRRASSKALTERSSGIHS